MFLYYLMNVVNIVQWGSVYKYFTSTCAFFQSSCGMVYIIINCTELSLLGLLLNLQFASHYDLLVLLHLIYC